MNIALLIPTLEAGGAERVLATMARYWATQGKAVSLITLSGTGTDFYPLPVEVNRVGLDSWAGPRTPAWAYRARKKMRSALQTCSPDVVISFTLKMNLLALWCRLPNIPVLVSERVAPQYPFGCLWRVLRWVMYPHARCLVVQTKRTAEAYNGSHADMVTIPNPVSTVEGPTDYKQDPARIVAMGRLHPQKGFDLLLRAFAESRAREHTELIIAGEGPNRNMLERLTQELGLVGSVHFPGIVQDVPALLQSADLFVLSSRYEGFPNVLAEAMAAGRPVIGFNCPSGPSEMIQNEVDGLLVSPEDVAGLTVAIDRLISSPEERQQFGGRAKEISERFSEERIMRLWDDLLTRVTGS